MRRFLIIIVLVCFNIAYSQQNDIDSLKNLLLEKVDESDKLNIYKELTDKIVKADILNENIDIVKDYYNLSTKTENYNYIHDVSIHLTEYYMANNDSLDSYNYGKKSLIASKKTKDISNILLSANQLGRAYDHFRNFKKAIEYYKLGLNHYNENKTGDTLRIIPQLYFNLSDAFYSINKNNEAIEAMLDGVKYAYTINDKSSVSSGYYFLAWRYMYLGNNIKADEYFKKSLKEAELDNNQLYIDRIHHGLGLNYSRMGDYKEAIHHDSLALKSYKNKGNKLIVFDILNNMTVAFTQMEDYKNAIRTAEQALSDNKGINKLYINAMKQSLIKSYVNTLDYDKAEKYLSEVLADTINPKSINVDIKISALEFLSFFREREGNYRDALKYYKQQKKLSDSLYIEKRNANFADIETKYQTEKKEKENLRLKSENAQQALLTQKANTQKWGFLIGLIVVLLAFVLIWRRYKAESKAKKIISDQKDTIETLQKDLHHRVKNNLSVIDAFIDELKDDVDDKTMLSKLSELQNRVLSINEVHAQLYKSTDVTSVGIKNYIDSIAENVASIFDKPNIKIENKVSEHLQLDPSRSSLMGLIVNEFVTNSFKYAFKDTGKIEIDISEDKDHLTIKLADNGKGLPENFNLETVTSYGFRIMKLLAKQLEGTFNFKNNHGLELNIQFPK
jgi:two-component sensor histidine kinase